MNKIKSPREMKKIVAEIVDGHETDLTYRVTTSIECGDPTNMGWAQKDFIKGWVHLTNDFGHKFNYLVYQSAGGSETWNEICGFVAVVAERVQEGLTVKL